MSDLPSPLPRGTSTDRQEPDLPLPDPYPEYVACPSCGEPEVEVWCYEDGTRCHQCGTWIPHVPGDCNPPTEEALPGV